MKGLGVLHLVTAYRDGRRWLVCHHAAGPAVFSSEKAARQHVEAIRADGVEYAIIRLWTESVSVI
ncbi:MAG: hypothetical protein M5U26_11700 [Planctomycetota bacterium]|nr:hypothetical protein [Planctomycetota bacterium]